jgi:hypothetical protein
MSNDIAVKTAPGPTDTSRPNNQSGSSTGIRTEYRPPATYSPLNTGARSWRAQDLVPLQEPSPLLRPAPQQIPASENPLVLTENYANDGPEGQIPSISHQAKPFSCSAGIVGLDGSNQEVSVALLLKIKTLNSIDETGGAQSWGCEVIAERFNAGLSLLDKTERTALQLEEIELTMGPRAAINDERIEDFKLYQRGYRAFFQKPGVLDLIVKDYSQGRGIGFGARVGYPLGISMHVNCTSSSEITRPGPSAAIDVKDIGCRELNNFYWRYGILPKPDLLPRSPWLRSAPFSDHSGQFSYSSEKPPQTIRTEIAVVCSIQPVPRSSRVPALFTPSFIRDRGVNYPCRHVRLKLRVDILPTERDTFVFPRAGFTAKHIDLGRYEFLDENGKLCLAISRDTPPVRLTEPQSFSKELLDGNWSVCADQPGDLKIRETGGDQQVAATEGGLHLPVTGPRGGKRT